MNKVKTKHSNLTYKSLMVREDTHTLIAVEAKKQKMTLDQLLFGWYQKLKTK